MTERVPLPTSVPERTVPQLLQRCVQAAPQRTAVIAPSYLDGERRLSYAELLGEAEKLAGALQEEGIGRGDRVAILVSNQGFAEAHVAYHATHRAGAINVPVNSRYVERELAYVLAFTEPKAVVFGPEFAGALSSVYRHRAAPLLLEASVSPQLGCSLRGEMERAEPAGPVEVDELDDADWIFTSGTTGNPKAVAITHAGSVACGYQTRRLWGLSSESVYASSAPFFTSTGCHSNLLAALAAGCTYLCEIAFDTTESLERIGRYRVTSTFIMSGMLGLMIKRHGADALKRRDLRPLQRLCYGGQPMPASFYQEVEEIFGGREALELVHLYGLTEGGTSGVMVPPAEHAEAVKHAGVHGMAVGTEGFNEWIDFRVCDEEGNPVPEGEIGEICLHGPALMDRYVDEPEATAEALRGGWLHTGDMGVIEDGRLYFVDRRKQMIRRGGLNISSAEVEAVVDVLPGVRECAAVPVPNPVLGEEVGLVVVEGTPGSLDEARVVRHCRENLADYKVPCAVQFVESLPRNAMGRVVKHELRALFRVENQSRGEPATEAEEQGLQT